MPELLKIFKLAHPEPADPDSPTPSHKHHHHSFRPCSPSPHYLLTDPGAPRVALYGVEGPLLFWPVNNTILLETLIFLSGGQ